VLLVKEAKEYAKKGKVVAAYESGCLGYVIERAFRKAGLECLVLPAQKVAAKRDDKIKTDKRDARLIARMRRNGEAKGIAVPSERDEAVRDLLRLREDLQDDVKRAKQRLSKFLLRYGYTWEERAWTVKYWEWVGKIGFSDALQKETCEEYRSVIKNLEERVARLDKRITELGESKEYQGRVKELRAFKGIEYQTALSVVTEIGDFRRFGSAKAFMSYLGFVPSEDSSGGKRRQGGITKAGNAHLRRLLVESAWHYARGERAGVRLEERRRGCGAEVIACADRALHRLHKKYARMVLIKGKQKNVAITGVARELAGFIWAVETGNTGLKTVKRTEVQKLAEEAAA
jgi:transposase